MSERWPMNDSPPNGRAAAEQRPERRRVRPRGEYEYSEDEDSYRGRKRYRDTEDRGPRRGYRSEAQDSRNDRHFRRNTGEHDDYNSRGRFQGDNGREPWRDEPKPDLNAIMKGSVHSVRPFGLLIVLPEHKRHGLVYHTQVSEGIAFDRDDDDESKVKALNYYFPVGKEAVSQVDGKDLDPENTVGKKFQSLKEEPPNVGTTHKAIVQSVKSYGAFVRLEGYKSNGLVHSSQVGCLFNVAGGLEMLRVPVTVGGLQYLASILILRWIVAWSSAHCFVGWSQAAYWEIA